MPWARGFCPFRACGVKLAKVQLFRNVKLDMNMKKFGIWAVAAALFFVPIGLSSCSMVSFANEMKGNLNFTQDAFVGEKPFKSILLCWQCL